MKIYVASSWRNRHYEDVLAELGAIPDVQVYDFKNDEAAFSWSETFGSEREVIYDKTWPVEQVARSILHPVAERGYKADIGALDAADLVVLVLPSGRSAHFEAGRATGMGKPLLIYGQRGDLIEPEVVYRAGVMCTSLKDLVILVEAIHIARREKADGSSQQGRTESSR